MAVIQRALAPVTEENPRVIIGGNRPPIDIEAKATFDEALDAKDGFRARIDQLLGAADRAAATDEESAGRCGELVKQIRAASKFISDAHVAAKAPYLLAGRVIDAAKNELVTPLDAAKKTVEGKQTQFLREEEAKRQAEMRRQREAEMARRREEEEAHRKIEAERENNGETGGESIPSYAREPAPVFIAEPEREIIRGDFGAAVSATKVWLSSVEDYEVAFIAVANNDKVREAIDKAIANMVRGGVHEIPGVRIWSDVKASNR